MSASLGSPPPTVFSSCSVSDLAALPVDSCLFNTPTMTVGDPTCGNGIREAGEACDCGSTTECTDSCCNAATCELAAGAQCASGECCTAQCMLVSYGTECRATSGSCDVAEYCSGDSGECPEDVHLVDGSSCSSGAGYCNDGLCPTHQEQCVASFGESQDLGLN